MRNRQFSTEFRIISCSVRYKKTVCETGKETETDVLLSEKYPDSQNGKSASGG